MVLTFGSDIDGYYDSQIPLTAFSNGVRGSSIGVFYYYNYDVIDNPDPTEVWEDPNPCSSNQY